MESTRKEIQTVKEVFDMAESSSSNRPTANDSDESWLWDEDEQQEEQDEEQEDDFDDFEDDEPVAVKKKAAPKKKKEEEQEEEEDFEDGEGDEEEEPVSKKKTKEEPKKEETENIDPELVEIPNWAKKLKELHPEQEFKSFEDYDKAVETHLNTLEGKIQNLETLTNKWGELATAYPGLDKFIESLELGESRVLAAMKMGISPEDYEVYDESELDAEAKILLKHENKKQKEARIKAQKEVQDNINKSTALVETFSKKKSLDESERDSLVANINQFVETVNKGVLTESFLEFLTKGIRYEKDTKKEAEHAYIRGRNEKFKVEKKKREGDGLPGLTGGMTPRNKPADTDDFIDNLDRVLKKFS